jgi:hypothetical protein
MTSPVAPQPDALSAIMTAPGTLLRAGAIGLGLVAMFTETIRIHEDVETFFGGVTLEGALEAAQNFVIRADLSALPWVFLLLIAVAMVFSAVPALARYVRLVDFLAAAAGVVLTIVVLITIATLAQRFSTYVDFGTIPNRRMTIDGAFTPTVGAFALMGATTLAAAAAIVPLLRRGRG